MVNTYELKKDPTSYFKPTGWYNAWYDLIDVYPYLFKAINASSKKLSTNLSYDVNAISVASHDVNVKMAHNYAQFKMRATFLDGTDISSDNKYLIRVETYQQGHRFILIDEQKVNYVCDPTNTYCDHTFLVLGHSGYFAFGDLSWIHNEEFYEMTSYDHKTKSGKVKTRWYRKYNMENLYKAGYLYYVIDDIPANKNLLTKIENNEEQIICKDLDKDIYNLDRCFEGMTHIPWDPRISDYIYWGNKKSNGAHKMDTIKGFAEYLTKSCSVDETVTQIRRSCYYQLNKDGGKVTVHKNGKSYDFYVSRWEQGMDYFEEVKANKKLAKAQNAGFNTVEEYEAHKKIVHSKLVMIRKYMKAHPGQKNPNWTADDIGLVWTVLTEDEQLIIKGE